MSTFIKIPGVNPPASRPRVDLVDPMLPDEGALYLYDPTHPAGAWGGGATVGLSIPNVAAASAAKLTGSALNGTLAKGGTTVTARRSSKGGIHLTHPEGAARSGEFVAMDVPSALAAYIQANPTHSYYMSQWTRTTRLASWGGTPSFTSTIHINSGSFLATIFHTPEGANTYPQKNLGADKLLGARTTYSPPLNTPALSSVGVSGWYGTAPTTSVGMTVRPFMLGGTGAVQAVASSPNLAIYRCYLEDLTVSGRTYAQVGAVDSAQFTEACLTADGRYYGDTV